MTTTNLRSNVDHWQDRVDLAAAFRRAARLNLHEAVSNHFSLAVIDTCSGQAERHFARLKAILDEEGTSHDQ